MKRFPVSSEGEHQLAEGHRIESCTGSKIKGMKKILNFLLRFMEAMVSDDKKEEHFYHPTTGYKGTRSEMDTYIVNRERKLKNGN